MRSGDNGGALEGRSFRAQVLRVIDGDTFEARVAIWPGLDITTKVRLRSVDAPELKARCVREHEMALAARERLAALLAPGPIVLLRVKPDKYAGRIDAEVFAGAETDVSQALLEAGLARRYSGGRRLSWCDGASARTAAR